ncbi:uncharacterized protein LOC115463679 isoform X2 [Microcaecilia unicolor]|uniref:Uncharacterized protein LOC115463679 isoform X2 n=1 Tax=Microcaecilia unicolor TaxID=1415580 RepID=A0A6P7XCK5_9AMPH|nr:uncharacterized protein LOC115463679 isoform X2 [Microcaecilia unicolor]
MKSMILCPLLFFFIFACSAVYWMKTDSLWTLHRFLNRQFTAEDIIKSRQFTAEDIIKSNMGIFMVETTEKLELSPLAACAIESAAQTYPDRSVYFFMKGLTKDMTITKSSFYKAIPLLSSIENVYILPLYFEDIFKDTPLDPWYQKVMTGSRRKKLALVATSPSTQSSKPVGRHKTPHRTIGWNHRTQQQQRLSLHHPQPLLTMQKGRHLLSRGHPARGGSYCTSPHNCWARMCRWKTTGARNWSPNGKRSSPNGKRSRCNGKRYRPNVM